MLMLTHFITGLILGKISKTPTQAIVAGLTSHFLLDYINHQETSDDVDNENKSVVFVDISFMLFLTGILVRRKKLDKLSCIGGVASIFPDFEHILPWNRSEKPPKRVFPSHAFNHQFHSKIGPYKFSLKDQFLIPIAICFVWIILDFPNKKLN